MAGRLILAVLAGLALCPVADALAQSAPEPPPKFELGPLGQQLEAMGDTCPPLRKRQAIAPKGWTTRMEFSIVDSPAGKVLMVAGEVFAGDAARLQGYLQSAPTVSEIWLDSPGGDAAEGPKIGRVIRQARLGTRVGAGYMCASSCTFAFLGGVVRRVEPGALYAVHTFFADQRPDSYLRGLNDGGRSTEQRLRVFREQVHEQERSNAMLAGELQLYGQQMGVARAFMTNVVFAQKSLVFLTDTEIRQLQASGMADSEIAATLQTIRCMGAAEMRKYNVVNVAD